MAAIAGRTDPLEREVTLTFGDPAQLIDIKRVVVIGTGSADNAQRRVLWFADVRWYLGRAWLEFDVNVRRRIGDTRVIGATVEAGLAVAATIAYAPWSINNVSAYTWTTFKASVLNYFSTGAHGRPALTFTTDTLSWAAQIGQVVQETVVSSTGEAGMMHAITSLPGASIYPDRNGVIHVCDATPGAEIAYLATLTTKDYMGHGSMVLINNAARRPALWHVYVDYEVEMRFTYNQSGTGPWKYDSGHPAYPYLYPVLQSTDFSLLIPAGIDAGPSWVSRRVGMGSWIRQDEAMAAWGPGAVLLFGTLPQLTDNIVADHYMGDALGRYTNGGFGSPFDPVWSGRIQSLKSAWRTTFQVNPMFWERVRHAWNVRAAVWDKATGLRAPSPVYANYHVSIVDHYVANQIKFFGDNNRVSYPPDGYLASGAPSGFTVTIVDEELGILEIVRDTYALPGKSNIIASPAYIVGNAGGATVTEAVGLNEAVLQKLDRRDGSGDGGYAWQLAVILSCTPAGPNDLGRLYDIPVTLTEASTTAGIAGVLTGFGPDIELRTRLADARVAWPVGQDDPDDAAHGQAAVQAILALFGVDDVAPDITLDAVDTTIVPINLEQELEPLAKAVAAASLLTMLDHYEGTQAFPAHKDFKPIGSITSVTHSVSENRFITTLRAVASHNTFDPTDFLTGSARSTLLKQIQQTGH